MRPVHLLGAFNNMADQVEVQKWLTTLELNLDALRRAAKGEFESRVRVRRGHIKVAPILRLARDLAVVARVIAPEGYDKDVQARERRDALRAGSVLERKKVDSDARPFVE